MIEPERPAEMGPTHEFHRGGPPLAESRHESARIGSPQEGVASATASNATADSLVYDNAAGDGAVSEGLATTAASGADAGALKMKDMTLNGAMEVPPGLRNITVLIVEDDSYQQIVLQNLFEKANEVNAGIVHIDVRVVSTGNEAMQLLNGPHPFSFDVVLLDVHLPDDVDGTQVLKGIRALPNGDKIGVVMASAFAQVPIVTRCMNLGANAYLQKPILLQSIKLIWQ